MKTQEPARAFSIPPLRAGGLIVNYRCSSACELCTAIRRFLVRRGGAGSHELQPAGFYEERRGDRQLATAVDCGPVEE